MMANRFRVLLSVAALLTLTAAQAKALFWDVAAFPGSMCVQWSSGGVYTLWMSQVGNASTTNTLWVDCPIPNDGYTDYSDYEVNGPGHAKGMNRHPTQALSCSYAAVMYDGADVDLWNYPIGEISGTTDVEYDAMTFPSGGVFFQADEVMYLSCSIPPKYNGNTSYLTMYSYEFLMNDS